MTREEAIRHFEYGVSNDIFSEPVTSYAKMAIAALREQDATDINVGNKWISVAERLPPGMADVLVVAFWRGRWQPMIGWYWKAEQDWRVYTLRGEVRPGGVTHWMPLPEAPKEV